MGFDLLFPTKCGGVLNLISMVLKYLLYGMYGVWTVTSYLLWLVDFFNFSPKYEDGNLNLK